MTLLSICISYHNQVYDHYFVQSSQSQTLYFTLIPTTRIIHLFMDKLIVSPQAPLCCSLIFTWISDHFMDRLNVNLPIDLLVCLKVRVAGSGDLLCPSKEPIPTWYLQSESPLSQLTSLSGHCHHQPPPRTTYSTFQFRDQIFPIIYFII